MSRPGPVGGLQMVLYNVYTPRVGKRTPTPCLLGSLLEIVDKVGHILVVVVIRVRAGRRVAALVGLSELLEVRQVVGAKLVDDAGKKVLQLLVLGMTTHNVGVSRNRRLDLRVGEMDHRAVVLEEVDLLDGGDVVHSKPFQRVLQPLVVRGCCLMDGLLLPAHRTLAACPHLGGHLLQLLRIHGEGRGRESWVGLRAPEEEGHP
mmetsp:Transcript_20571/g.42106  ORF Transcript_20571/g.42106 Transcript_20571/m.42106 type:complete len:204 (-) Transcript_20571:6-617(-)